MSLPFFLSSPSSNKIQKLAYSILKVVFCPEEINTLSFFDILNRSFLMAVFWRKDEELLDALRTLYLKGLATLVLNLNQLQEFELIRYHEYIRHCLCFLPYFEFPEATILSIPYFDEINKTFILKNYQVIKIALNKQQFWMNQADLCYAYGLVAVDSSEKYLIFSGTTYPCGEGFWTHVRDDISLGRDVGYFLYHEGKTKIEEFIDDASVCQVLGTSLGGGMALQLALDQPNLKSVYALNPPGRMSMLPATTPTALTTVVIQANDFVSKFGFWHPHWSIVHYDFEGVQEAPHPIFDHISNYLGLSQVTRQPLDADDLNRTRFWQTNIIFIGLRGMIAVVLVWPICYLVVPILKKIYEFFENLGQKTAATLQFA